MKEKLNKELLEVLYNRKRLTTREVGKSLGCSQKKVLYWMKKYNIPSRKNIRKPKYNNITKNILEGLYIKKRLPISQVAKKLCIPEGSMWAYFKRFNIPRRTISESTTRFPKKDFSGNLIEKAYIIGLRCGDIHARRNCKLIRVQVSTTHLSQIKMFIKVFGIYGHSYYHTSTNPQKEMRIQCDLNESFSFILEKPKKILKWILANNELFYSFLTGYFDCEGSLSIEKHAKNNVKFEFFLGTTDRMILSQIKNRLQELGYKTKLYLGKRKGYTSKMFGKYNKDLYTVRIFKRENIFVLINNLLKFSRHDEKTRKMKLIMKIKKEKHWSKIKDEVLNLKHEIEQEHIDEILNEFGSFRDLNGLKRIYNEIERVRHEESFSAIS